MTIIETKLRVMAIVDLQKDFEAAHGAEDKLYRDLLKSISDGKCEDPKKCARLALQSKQVKFKRSYS